MQRQTSASPGSFEKFARKSERELFLERMNQVLPWGELLALAEPHYLAAENDDPSIALTVMLRTYLVQHWFRLSDSGTEEALYESKVLRGFAGVDLDVAAAPDEAAIRRFRLMLEWHDPRGELMTTANRLLDERGIRVTSGADADEKILAAPFSTDNNGGEPHFQMDRPGSIQPFQVASQARLTAHASELVMHTVTPVIFDAHSLPEPPDADEEQPGRFPEKEPFVEPDVPGYTSYREPTEVQDIAAHRAKTSVIACDENVSPGQGALSIAVISPDKHRRNAAITAVGECHKGPIREFTSYPPNLEAVPRMLTRDFDVVVVDLDSDTKYALDLVKSICVNGLATVIVFTAQTDPNLLLSCMRAGAREFLTLPFAPGTMAEALVRVSTFRLAFRPEKKTAGRLFAFISAKGGSGVTILACNYAVSLAEESGSRTLFIDLNLPLGDAAINLGINARHSVVSALQNYKRLDSNFLSGLLVQHSSGLFVLPAPSELASTHVSDEAINKLLEVARHDFDYVVVDAGSKLDLQSTKLFDKSSTIYLVTQVGIAELRNSNRVISRFSTIGSPKLEIVLNRYDPRTLEISEESVTKALTRPAQWKIPNHYTAVRQMQNTATSLMQGDSQISRAIREMTRSICGQPALPEKKKGFSFFR
jgi:pilus assembly protein CpaE